MARRRVKKNFLKLIITIVIAIIFVGGSIYIVKNVFKNDSEVETKNPGGSKNPTKPKQNEEYKINFLATGDGLVHNIIYVKNQKSDGSYDFSSTVKYVKPIVSKYDIAYYNQETPFGGKGTIPCGTDTSGYCGYPRFNTPSEFGDAMLDAGFNTVSLASNHSYDSGSKGIINSVKYWKGTDALYSGMYETEEDTTNYIIKEKNNITYTMLSYTTLDNGISSVVGNKQYMVAKFDRERVKKDIEALRDKVDVLMVAMHWGVEYVKTPPKEEKDIAQFLADLGVDIVIGNHSHVLQPVTKIGDTIVFYSLGNFISNQYGKDDWSRLVGFMATLDITKTVTPEGEKTIKIDNIGGELIFTKYTGDPINTSYHTGHTVIPFSIMKDDSYLKDYKRVYKKYTDLLQSMGTELNIVPLPE